MIKNHFISNTRDWLKFYRLSGVTFYDCINTMSQFIRSFLDNKMSIFEGYGAFNDKQSVSLQKPTDLDLHCLQRQGISGFSRTRVIPSEEANWRHQFIQHDKVNRRWWHIRTRSRVNACRRATATSNYPLVVKSTIICMYSRRHGECVWH